jgi:hypothetical protein
MASSRLLLVLVAVGLCFCVAHVASEQGVCGFRPCMQQQQAYDQAMRAQQQRDSKPERNLVACPSKGKLVKIALMEPLCCYCRCEPQPALPQATARTRQGSGSGPRWVVAVALCKLFSQFKVSVHARCFSVHAFPTTSSQTNGMTCGQHCPPSCWRREK